MATYTADQLSKLSNRDLLAAFRELPAPAFGEMHGDYKATLLSQPTRLADWVGQLTVNGPGRTWRSKAFRPVDEVSGRGYNTFVKRSGVVQRYPMATQMALSRFDGQPAYCLVYRAFNSVCGYINMVDEIRSAGPGVYLGIGTWGFTDRQRRIPLPFVLEDVGWAYAGDFGEIRADFTPGPRELPGGVEAGPARMEVLK